MTKRTERTAAHPYSLAPRRDARLWGRGKLIPFWKMSGSGNDFVLIDNRRRLVSANISATAARICDRHFGVGADGLLLLEPSRHGAFRMLYFNADGSRASMCGNGARCMAWFAHKKGVVGSMFQFSTDAGLVKSEVNGASVKVQLTNVTHYRSSIPVRVEGRTLRVAFVNTGVPHVVVRVRDVKAVDVHTLGRLLRFHKAFGPKGANVNFVERLSSHTLRIRTY